MESQDFHSRYSVTLTSDSMTLKPFQQCPLTFVLHFIEIPYRDTADRP